MNQRLTKTQIRELLDVHGSGPSRALGQNFLCDGMMVDKIVRLSGVQPGDSVIEIGPGLGSLTLGLLDAGAQVEAIEIDRYMLPLLEETVGQFVESGQLRIHNHDVLKLDWEPLLQDRTWSVVANLPYNIATPLLLDLLVGRPEITKFLVMVQREAGERLVSEPNRKSYGIPSVLARYWAAGRVVGSVKAELFYPRPKVESVLVLLERNADLPDCDYEVLRRLVRAGFGQRRKMIRRSLQDLVSVDQIEQASVDPRSRPEQLGLSQWVELAQVWSCSNRDVRLDGESAV